MLWIKVSSENLWKSKSEWNWRWSWSFKSQKKPFVFLNSPFDPLFLLLTIWEPFVLDKLNLGFWCNFISDGRSNFQIDVNVNLITNPVTFHLSKSTFFYICWHRNYRGSYTICSIYFSCRKTCLEVLSGTVDTTLFWR